MADTNWDYIAGFIDGEGSFTIACQDTYYHPRLSISQNTLEVLEKMQELFTLHGITSYISKESHMPRGNTWYNLRVNARESLLKICNFLEKRLIVKEKQLLVIKRLLQLPSGDSTRKDLIQKEFRMEESQICREEIMNLNHVGGAENRRYGI